MSEVTSYVSSRSHPADSAPCGGRYAAYLRKIAARRKAVLIHPRTLPRTVDDVIGHIHVTDGNGLEKVLKALGENTSMVFTVPSLDLVKCNLFDSPIDLVALRRVTFQAASFTATSTSPSNRLRITLAGRTSASGH